MKLSSLPHGGKFNFSISIKLCLLHISAKFCTLLIFVRYLVHNIYGSLFRYQIMIQFRKFGRLCLIDQKAVLGLVLACI